MDDSVQRKYGGFQRKTIAGKPSQSHRVAKFTSDESLRAQSIRFAPQCTRRIKFPMLHKSLTIRDFPALPIAARSHPDSVLPARLRMSEFPGKYRWIAAHSGSLLPPFEPTPHPAGLRHPGKCRQTRLNGLPHFSKPVTILRTSGYSAAWLARLTGGQEVVGSNPASPTPKTYNSSSIAGSRGCFRFLSQTHTPRQPFLLASLHPPPGHSHASSDRSPRNQAPDKVPAESHRPALSLLRLLATTLPPLNQTSRTPPGPVAQADRIAPETQVPRR